MAGGRRASVVSSTTIIMGPLFEETYTVFRHWNFEKSSNWNLDTMRRTNSVGARSASWLYEIYKVLHRRFDPDGRDRSLVELAKRDCPLDVWKPLLLWHMTRDEFLLRDFLVNWLYEHFAQGAVRLRSEDLWPYLRALHDKGAVPRPWTESTLKRVASALLKVAVDFQLLRGASVREFASYHLPEEAFLYLLHAMIEQQPSAHAVVHSTDWHLFLMNADDVERELFRLHQYRSVHYEVAGSIAQIKLPYPSAADCAREMMV